MYWINGILLIGYFELKTIINVRIHSNGRMVSPRAPFPQVDDYSQIIESISN